MSNLVTPMLTSVDKSPVDFYSPNICFSNSTCGIINSGKEHQICLNNTPVWDDLEKLVNKNSKYYSTSTCGRDRINVARKSITNNNVFSNDSTRNFELKIRSPSSDINIGDNLHLVAFSDSPESNKYNEQLWNSSNSENNSCLKACVNVNMGYNEGSSMESVISSLKSKDRNNFPLLQYPVTEVTCVKSPETKSLATKSDLSTTQLITTSSPLNSRNVNQIKTFKNNSKTGHSRMWGSCGSAGTLQLNFDIKNLTTTNPLVSLDSKPRSQSNVSSDFIVMSETEIRNRPFVGVTNMNKLKRISQVSFEAEFDSEGRTHEQISVDIRKWDPFIIAGQITFIELSYFKAVKAEEFMSFKWTGLSKHIHAPAIVASTRWFNQLNFWAQRIILECTDLNGRSEMLSYLIRILKKLVDHFNNLSSGMAVMSALQVECIHRLKNTWNNISNKDKATFRRMEELFSGENNYEKLRIHIDFLKLPCIPYLGLYLTDLTYINVAHSKLSEFESQTKTDQINNILRTVNEFQQSEYDIIQNATLYRYFDSQRYIEELQKIIEENNYRTSVFLEPNVTDSSLITSKQQQPDHPVISSSSPQKTPPSYACKHSSNPGSLQLQLPISPKQMSSTLLNESIKELSEQTPIANMKQDNQSSTGDDIAHIENPDDADVVHIISNEPSLIGSKTNQDILKNQVFDILKVSDIYKEDDSLRTSFLCGVGGRRSNFKKKPGNKTIRFKRDSSSSSHQQMSSRTATLSSSSYTASVDKDGTVIPSMSLLDDSYLDATLTETCSVPTVGSDVSHQQLVRPDSNNVDLLSVKHKEVLCSPPICRCKIKGGSVDLKPKSSSNRKTEMRNLIKIAHVAESAVQYSKKNTSFYTEPSVDSENGNDNSSEDKPGSDDHQDSAKLICQGVLSRKTCFKNNKKPRFSMWNRYWVVLIVSGSNAYLVYFENSHYRASERKDFKYKKCHVQDLKGVTISLNKPPFSGGNVLTKPPIDANSPSEKQSDLNRFFIIDKEYGTVYKFRNAVIKRRKSLDKIDTENEQCLQSSSSCQQFLNLAVWYRRLSQCINRINKPLEYNKDLIVLNDS